MKLHWYQSVMAAAGTIVRRCGFPLRAAAFSEVPSQERPIPPTRPFDHGWAAIVSRIESTSARSLKP
jgi:hypothetical protein